MNECPHCGVDDCEATFHECLVRDFTDPGFGIVHHLTVGAYMLQHNAYTDEMASHMADFVLEHLDRPPGETEKHRLRAWTDGAQRVTRRGVAPPLALTGGWPLTIADVDAQHAEAYCTTVRAWAQSVARIIANE
ncbi:DUF5946 family protein [Mycobacterium deserti]|uniref:DUF5946 family protein n=1 Tax=Mycobacterium deserti TaxID=2978347 RepID=A0ABT2MC61_9MYCO|nr:DUF5946 family protein [Mycobacterium deserti]MCT7659855.1 DUF5946 family protein [Mycobacterium deserti]